MSLSFPALLVYRPSNRVRIIRGQLFRSISRNRTNRTPWGSAHTGTLTEMLGPVSLLVDRLRRPAYFGTAIVWEAINQTPCILTIYCIPILVKSNVYRVYSYLWAQIELLRRTIPRKWFTCAWNPHY